MPQVEPVETKTPTSNLWRSAARRPSDQFETSPTRVARREMSSETRLRRREWVGATTGAGVAAAFMFSTAIVLGTIASSEAFGLVEAILPTARFLAVGVLTAAITVLALLLTLLGISLNGPYAFRSRFYFRIGRITTLSTAAIVAAVLLLLISGLPLEDIEDAQRFYDLYFYASPAASLSWAGWPSAWRS
jgi:hypothetical protein